MSGRKQSFWLVVLCCAVFGLIVPQPASGQRRRGGSAEGGEQDILGTVVGVGGQYGGRTTPFRLIVNQYTSADEAGQLNEALRSGGQEELLRVLSRMKAGRIVVGNGVGVDANAIIAAPQENGTKLIVLYERRVNFYESRYGTRSQDYRFGYAEIFLRRRGNSEGTFIPAAKVRLRDGNTWEVEDFGVFPARLMGLQARGRGGRVR